MADNFKSVCEDKVKTLADEIEDNAGNLYDYLLNNMIEAEYIVDFKGRFKDVRVYMTLGGPAVWIDTEECAVRLTWSGTEAFWGLTDDVVSEVREIFEEAYNSL